MIQTQSPKPVTAGGGDDFEQTLAPDGWQVQARTVLAMRDDHDLQARHYPSETTEAPLLFMANGSGWHGMQSDTSARALGPRADPLGEVTDVDWFEGNVANVIAPYRKDGQTLVSGGDSSGGAVASQNSSRLNMSFSTRGDYLDNVAGVPPFVSSASAVDAAVDAALDEPSKAAISDTGAGHDFSGVARLDVVEVPQPQVLIRKFSHEC